MKKKDLATIIAAIGIATLMSFLISNQFISSPENRQQKVEVVAPISADFTLPDKNIFNAQAVNPTKLIEIGPNTNNQPFVNQ